MCHNGYDATSTICRHHSVVSLSIPLQNYLSGYAHNYQPINTE